MSASFSFARLDEVNDEADIEDDEHAEYDFFEIAQNSAFAQVQQIIDQSLPDYILLDTEALSILTMSKEAKKRLHDS